MGNRHLLHTGVLFFLCLLLAGCSYSDLIPGSSPTETVAVELPPALSSTPLPTQTIGPPAPTPSFTPTPTLIYLSTLPNENLPTTPAVTSTAVIGTPIGTATPPVPTISSLFTQVELSVKQIFWGACSPGSTSVKVHVDQSAGVQTVLLAVRLENPKTADTTPWGGYSVMKKSSSGDFTYQLAATSFSHYNDYISAWGQFQFIGVNRDGDIIARSEPFPHLLVVAPCP